MKRLFFCLALILLLVSCSSKQESIALASYKGVEIYAKNKKDVSLIVLDQSVMDVLVGENGRDIQFVLEGIYDGKVYYVMDSIFQERQELYRTLLEETKAEDVLELWGQEGKRLENTRFLSYLNGCTGGFEEELAKMLKKRVAGRSVFQANDVLGENCNYETAIIFLKRWIKAIIG